MLHGIESNQRPSPTQTRLAVNCNSTCLALSDLEKGLGDLRRRDTSIGKEEVVVVETSLLEDVLVIGFVVEADNTGDVELVEHRDVILWCVHLKTV